MFEKGKIDIVIPKTNFNPGDMISGNVVLALKKPIKAKEISISLIGEQTTVQGGIMTGGSRSTNKVRIYDFKQQLDAEKEYDKSSVFHFEIKIPADIQSRKQQQMPQMEGTLGDVFNIAQTFIGVKTTTTWHLSAKLDIPWGTDIRKEMQITIG